MSKYIKSQLNQKLSEIDQRLIEATRYLEPYNPEVKFNERFFPESTKITNISKQLIDELKNIGEFRKEADKIYFLEYYNQNLIQIPFKSNDSEWGHFLNDKFGISDGMPYFVKIYTDLKTEAYIRGKKINVYSFFHYDSSANILYFSSNEDKPKIYLITKDSITVEKNGYDNVFFLCNKNYSPLLIDLNQKIDEDFFKKYILDNIWFAKYSNLTVQDNKIVYSWIYYSQFFGSIIKEKPIIVYLGNAGSGKTSTAKILGIILFGANFSQINIPKDEKDFYSIILNNKYIVIDNVDGKVPDWFIDSLAAISTGGGIKVRRLYNDLDSTPLEARPNCFISLTSRSPKFNREDINTRSIIFNLNKGNNSNSSNFLTSIIKNRSNIVYSSFKQLQKILFMLQENKDDIYDHNFRMDQFADFILRTSSDKKSTLEILDKFSLEQTKQSINKYEWLVLLLSKLEIDPDLFLEPLSATQILDILENSLEKNNFEYTQIPTVNQIGVVLNTLQNELNKIIDFEIVQTGNNRRYKFSQTRTGNVDTNNEN